MNRLSDSGRTKCRAGHFQTGLRIGLFLTFLLMVLALQGTMPPCAFAEKPLLKEVRLEKISAQEVRVFISLTGFCLPEIFPIEEKKLRLVCDFPGAGMAGNMQQPIACDGKIIESVRIGVHYFPKSKTRLVFDLPDGYAYDVDQIYSQEDNRLVIVIRQNEKQ